jgi:DNA-binding NtrC family response regulator
MSPPTPVTWSGPSPSPRLRRELAILGLTLDAKPGTAVTIVATAHPRVPKAVDGAWIWAPPRAIDDEVAIAAARAGAYDAIALDRSDAALALSRRIAELGPPISTAPPRDFIAQSAAARRVLEEIARAAETSMPVLLTGETGIGKDVAARMLHARSSRAKRRFVAINCAAVPNELIESELFGYVRGAFSGAVRDYDGQLTAAAGGSIFLDEIDDTPPSLQAKLLRVLEDRVVSRLGENEWHQVDFRIITATNRDLVELVARGDFADDLYQRLAIVQIHMPPLRERLDDLEALAVHFVHRFYAEERGPRRHGVRTIAPPALRALTAYPWPGNVRELRNVVYQALVGKRGGDELLAADLPRRILDPRAAAPPPGIDRAALARRITAGTMNLRALLAEIEREALSIALEHAAGSPARAARLLGEVGRGASTDPGATVRAMMRRLGVSGSRD